MTHPDFARQQVAAYRAEQSQEVTVHRVLTNLVDMGLDSGEIVVFFNSETGWWQAHVVGGRWSDCPDEAPNVSAHSPYSALALLLALPAFSQEKSTC